MAVAHRGWNVLVATRIEAVYARRLPSPARMYRLPVYNKTSPVTAFMSRSRSESCDLLNEDRQSSTRNSLFLFNLDCPEDGQVS